MFMPTYAKQPYVFAALLNLPGLPYSSVLEGLQVASKQQK